MQQTKRPHRAWLRVSLPDEQQRLLKESATGWEFVSDSNADPAALADVDAIYSDGPIPDELVARLTGLKWIHTTRGGAFPFFTPMVIERQIKVTTSTGIHGAPFAQYALACILAFASRFPESWHAQREHRWERLVPEPLAGKTLGILGLGTAGLELARLANLLGLRVIATKRTVNEKPAFVDELGTPEFMPELLRESDFVVILLPSVPSMAGYLGEQEIRLMKPAAYLINLATGRAVDEDLLVRALKERWIAGAALDALPNEPLRPESALWDLPNVLISAHVGGVMPPSRSWELALPIFIENLQNFQAGEPMRNQVDHERGY